MTSITHQQLLQHFQAIRILGQGSFGKVFLVRHKQSRIQYAMKKYSKYHILKNGKEKSLIRSSRILQVLEHKNIIRFLYYAIDDEKDEIFLVFEACKKGSLQQIKEKVFEMKELTLIKQIMYQLTEALLYLKSVAVAHRDVKPSNISFSSEGELKLIDFDEAICFKQSEQLTNKDLGFAKQLSEQTSTMKLYSRRSRANSFVGTQMYMSPEMKHSTITDERGDIWAYGCILYELVSGRSLMNEYDETQDIQEIINKLYDELEDFQINENQIHTIIHLLKNVLQQIPEYRMPVQKIIGHDFFKQYLDNSNKILYRTKLRKFLRGNFNLSDPKHILDALKMDLIGMTAGNQKFLELTQYPILIRFQKQLSMPLGFFQKIKQLYRNLLNISFFKVNYIMGGSKYFKIRSALKQQDKSYIFYDEIDSIKIEQNSIVIEGSNQEKWNIRKGQRKQAFKWRYSIKSLTDDQFQLGNLYEAFLYICND